MAALTETVALAAAESLELAAAAKKCAACGFLASSVAAIESAVGPDADGGLLGALAAARGHVVPARYDCLGCEVCWPAAGLNAVADATGLPQPTVSHHLRILADRGLVRGARQGTRIYYCLEDDGVMDAARPPGAGRAMMPATAVVYCRPGCAACGALTGWLGHHGVRWVTRDVLADADAADRVVDLGFRSLPVVETAGGRSAWGGDLDAVAALFAGAAGGHRAPTRAPAGPGASHG